MKDYCIQTVFSVRINLTLLHNSMNVSKTFVQTVTRFKPLKENENLRNSKQGYMIREGLKVKSSSQVLSRYLLKI